MIQISVPGSDDLTLKYLVLDYNGTIAFDGKLYDVLKPLLVELSDVIEIHVLTADTFGDVKQQIEDLPLTLYILSSGEQDKQKQEYVIKLGKENCACIGNGRNDKLMLKEAGLGIALIQEEGACAQTLIAADIICKTITSALELLLHPKRMIATLRV
ncbi:MAG: ATPase P [Desulfobacterium sp.]|nr:ATPase P [Desulfobacterium sp.]MBU3947462.1 ATPase P [Pseudomonadota bacterium]MBU4010859.1 ATPase P [Pseudomonadota bacterium]